jgi:hypothetical protein
VRSRRDVEVFSRICTARSTRIYATSKCLKVL